MRPLTTHKTSELALSFKILIPTALMFFLFVYFSYFVVLPFVERYLMNQKRQMLRSMSTGVWHLLDDYRKNAQSGGMTDDEARSQALASVKRLRFGPEGKDYFWINDLSVVVLMHPYQLELVGRSLSEHTDPSGRRVFFDAINMVKQSGEGFIDDHWQRQGDPSRIVRKLSYFKLYKPWGWVLGTGLYVEDVHVEIAVLTRKLLWLLMGVVVVSVVCVMWDISERKAAELQLKQTRDALEIRVRERTDALVKINAQLENEIRKQERTECVLRESEEKLIQSERLAATGQLAASIAHEINSPLQGVTSLLNVIRREYGDDENLVEHLNLIKGAFNSIRNTVKNLMDLNRPGKEKNQPLRLQDVLNQTGALVNSFLDGHRVGLHLDFPPDLPVIMGSPQQLGQVFMNLINNAVEAMNTDPQPEDRHISIQAAVDGDQIAVVVADNGAGISEEDASHIFDAFFTRKKKLGMGVGLSICHRIIEDHNGTISVRSRPGGGAEFTVRLPYLR